MKGNITKEERQMLWVDEMGDEFLLTKYGEIFQSGKTKVKVHTWSRQVKEKAARVCVIWGLMETDDPLWVFETDISNLEYLISLGRLRKRPWLGGRWLKEAKERLCHDIIAYEPVVLHRKLVRGDTGGG